MFRSFVRFSLVFSLFVGLITWADYKMAGPIRFATDHRGTYTGNPVHIFLTGVSVKLAGASDFVPAK